MKIKTNNHWQPIRYRYEVPEKVLRDRFDWLDEDETDGFMRRHGTWYHVSEFERVPPGSDLAKAGWDGMLADSISSGTLVKISKDAEEYILASWSA